MFQTLASVSTTNPSLHFTPLPSQSHHHPPSYTHSTSFASPSRPTLSIRCQATVQDFATDTSTSIHHRRSPASLYDVLRVNRTASITEIKTAYRTLAKLYHPDTATAAAAAHESEEEEDELRGRRHGNDDFIAIRNAYETLSDPSARALYDLSLGFGAIRRGSGGEIRFETRSWAAADDRRTTSGFYPTRRWETDQCW